MANQPAEIAQLTMETQIDAPPERVWQALTENIGGWWPVEKTASATTFAKRILAGECSSSGTMAAVYSGAR